MKQVEEAYMQSYSATKEHCTWRIEYHRLAIRILYLSHYYLLLSFYTAMFISC